MNIPQFIIQLIYVKNQVTDGDVSQLSPAVLISMGFSVMAILNALVTQISNLCQNCVYNKKSHFRYEIEINSDFIVKCTALRKQHAFAHSRINHAIMDTLGDVDQIKKLRSKCNIVMDSHVYFIESRIYTLNEIEIFFQLKILTNNTNIKNVFYDNVKYMAQIGHRNYHTLSQILTKTLQLLPKSALNAVAPNFISVASNDTNIKVHETTKKRVVCIFRLSVRHIHIILLCLWNLSRLKYM